MITFSAPAAMCLSASSRLVNRPVDSITILAPSSFHGRFAGSRSASTRSSSPSTTIASSVARTSFGSVPSTESYFSRWARVLASVMSFTATKSQSTPRCLAARKKLRPIRPKPLMPILTPIGHLLPGGCPHPSRSRGGAHLRRSAPGLWPEGPLWTGARRISAAAAGSPIDVAVVDRDGKALVAEERGEVVGHDHRAVTAPRAPDAHREVRLPFRDEPRDHEAEERPEPSHELPVGLLASHVGLDRLVGADERAELVDPVRVGQEADVDDEIGVAGGPVLVSERDDRDLQVGFGRGVRKGVAQPLPKLVRGEARGVEDQVG